MPEADSAWVPLSHHDSGKTLSEVIATMKDAVDQGFYRVVQTQRMIRAEKVDGKIKLHKKPALTEECLNRSVNAYYRDDLVRAKNGHD